MPARKSSRRPAASPLSGAARNLFHRRLLRWFDAHRRDLPWRRNPDPYRVWVAEIMLQQTQVKTVLPYYERFLSRFPNILALAGADEEQVVAQWSGLGYYGRARRLHEAAREIQRSGGAFPSDFDQILELPGIGRYTAGAIASIAFGRRKAVVDGNVQRFFSRYFGSELRLPECWKLAETLLPLRRAGDYNQALMEMGATVCRPAPACAACPVSEGCASVGASRAVRRVKSPRTGAAARALQRTMVLLVVRRGERFWLERRNGTEELLKNLWCLPLEYGAGDADVMAQCLLRQYRLAGPSARGRCTHTIMQYRFRVTVVETFAPATFRGEGRWFSARTLHTVPHSSLVRKALAACLEAPRGRPAEGR